MSCTSCGAKPPTYLPPPATPVHPPAPAPCVGAEPCYEIQDSTCVAYTGVPLEFLGALTGDRLTKILLGINEAFGKLGENLVYFKGSKQIEVVGTGSQEDPYYIRPILDKVDHNLLKARKTGLSVVIDKPEILRMLQLIALDPDLKDALCAIGCVGQPVMFPPPTNFTVEVSPTLSTASATTFVLNWVAPLSATPATVQVQHRPKNGLSSEWLNIGSPLPATTTTLTVAGKLNNTLYEFRLLNALDPLQLASTEVVEIGRPMAVGNLTVASTETSLKFSFAELGRDVDSYTLVLKKGTQLISTVTKPAIGSGNTITHTFPNLLNLQPYHLDIITNLGAFTLLTDKGIHTPEAGSTTPDPTPSTCPAPTAVSATLV